MTKIKPILLFLILLLIQGIAYSMPPQSPNIEFINGSSQLSEIYTTETQLTITGSTQINTLVQLWNVNEAGTLVKLSDVDIQPNADNKYVFTKTFNEGHYRFKSRAWTTSDAPTPQYSAFGSERPICVDRTPPVLSPMVLTRWIGNAYWVASSQLLNIVALAKDDNGDRDTDYYDGSAFGSSPTVTVYELYDYGSGIAADSTAPANGWGDAAGPIKMNNITYTFNGTTSYIYLQGWQGKLSPGHFYEARFQIMDRSGNLSRLDPNSSNAVGVKRFKYDGVEPPLINRAHIYIYDPKHLSPTTNPGAYGCTEPTNNKIVDSAKSMEITGEFGTPSDILVGYVKYYRDMIIQTNPTRLVLKFNPELVQSDQDLELITEYLNSWSYVIPSRAGGGYWRYFQQYNDSKVFPVGTGNATNLDNWLKKGPDGWMAGTVWLRPQGYRCNQWFYTYDKSRNGRGIYDISYICTSGPPQTPYINNSGQQLPGDVSWTYKADPVISQSKFDSMFDKVNNPLKIPPDWLVNEGEDVRKPTKYTGVEEKSGDPQTIKLWFEDQIDRNASPHPFPYYTIPSSNQFEQKPTWTVSNTNLPPVRYNQNRRTTLYRVASNPQFGEGPYDYNYIAWCDNTNPVYTNALAELPPGVQPWFNAGSLVSQNVLNIIGYATESPYDVEYPFYGLDFSSTGSKARLFKGSDLNNPIPLGNDQITWTDFGDGNNKVIMGLKDTLSTIKNTNDRYFLDLYLQDVYLNNNSLVHAPQAVRQLPVFLIDNKPPGLDAIEPASGTTVNSLDLFSAKFLDPVLDDGTSGAGSKISTVKQDNYCQLEIYKVLAYEKPSGNNLTFLPVLPNSFVDITESLATQSVFVNHAGKKITPGTILEIWDKDGQVVANQARLVINEFGVGNVIVTVNESSGLLLDQKYYIIYPVPTYYETWGNSTLLSIPYDPVRTIGTYKLKVRAIDNAENRLDQILDYEIKYDPPFGLFPLNRTPYKNVTANGEAFYTFTGGPIKTKSGKFVKKGTMVHVATDFGFISEDQDESPSLPGIQIYTKDDSGNFTFKLRSNATGTANAVRAWSGGVDGASDGAYTRIGFDNYRCNFIPDVINRVIMVMPGQTMNTSSMQVVGQASVQKAGIPFNIKVYAFDAYAHLLKDLADQIKLYSNDPFSVVNNNPTAAIMVTCNNDGAYTFQVYESIARDKTYFVTDLTHSNIEVAGSLAITCNVPAKLLTLLPDQVPSASMPGGRVENQLSRNMNTDMEIRVNITDAYFNRVDSATATVRCVGNLLTAISPASQISLSDRRSFIIKEFIPGDGKTIRIEDVAGVLSPSYTSPYNINAGPATQLQVLIPDQRNVLLTGTTGNVPVHIAGTSFIVTINAVDQFYNIDRSTSNIIQLASWDPESKVSINPSQRMMISGVCTFQITEYVATEDTRLKAALIADEEHWLSDVESNTYNVLVKDPYKLMILLPGEELDPGFGTSKKGKANQPIKDRPFTVTVYAVDTYTNRVYSEDIVRFVNLEQNYTTVNHTEKQMVNGMVTFSVTEIQIKEHGLAVTCNTLIGDQSVVYKARNSNDPCAVELILPPQAIYVGTAFTVTVNVLDPSNNVRAYTEDVPGLILASSIPANAYAINPLDPEFINGVATFSVTFYKAGTYTLRAVTKEGLLDFDTEIKQILPGGLNRILLEMEGQTFSPFVGMSGIPREQMASKPFSFNVYAVDQYSNLINSNITVGLSLSDIYAAYPSTVLVNQGKSTVIVTCNTQSNLTWIRATANNVSAVTVNVKVAVGDIYQLQLLMPGRYSIPGSGSEIVGVTENVTAGYPFVVTVNAVDIRNNILNIDNEVEVYGTNSCIQFVNARKSLKAGTATFSVTEYVSTSNASSIFTMRTFEKTLTSNTVYDVLVGTPNRLQVLLPLEVNVPGTEYPDGKRKPVIPYTPTAGVSYALSVLVVDNYYNVVTAQNTEKLELTANYGIRTIDPDQYTINGTAYFTVKEYQSGKIIYTAKQTIINKSLEATTSITVQPDAIKDLQIIYPGEVHTPGDNYWTNAPAKGKAGLPIQQKAGEPFTVTVNLTDQFYNLIPTMNKTVQIDRLSSYEVDDTNKLFVGGVATFSITPVKATTNNAKLKVKSVTEKNWLSNKSYLINEGDPGVEVDHGVPFVMLTTGNVLVTANGFNVSTVTVTIADKYINYAPPIYNYVDDQRITIKLHPDYSYRLASDVIVTVNAITSKNGESYFTISSTKAGEGKYIVESIDPSSNTKLNQEYTIHFVGDSSNFSTTLSYITESLVKVWANSPDAHSIRVFCKDIFGNTLEGQKILLASSRASDNIVIVNDVTNDSGYATFKVFSSLPGTSNIRARNLVSGDWLTPSINLGFAVDYDHPSSRNSIIQIIPKVREVGELIRVEATIYDRWGNLITGNSLSIETNRGSIDNIYNRNNLPGKISGQDYAFFEMRSFATGSGNVFVKYSKTGELLSIPGNDFRYLPASLTLSKCYFMITPNIIGGDGESVATVSVFAGDSFGNPVYGVSVNIVSSRPSLDSIITLNANTDIKGFGYFTVSSIGLGVSTLSATVRDSLLSQTQQMTVIKGKIIPDNCIIAITKNIALANNNDYIHINLLLHDRMNNSLDGITINAYASRGPDFITPNTIISDSNGIVSFKVFSTKIGNSTINIRESQTGIAITDNLTVSFVVDKSLVSSFNSIVSITPNSIIADNFQVSKITVKLNDIYNNPIDSSSVRLSAKGVTLSIVPSVNSTTANGEVDFYVKGIIAGDTVITAYVPTYTVTINQTAALRLIPDRLHISPTLSTMQIISSIPGQPYIESYANGKSLTSLRVTIRDLYGNLVNDKVLTANSTRGDFDQIKAINASNITGYDMVHNGEGVFYISSIRLGSPIIQCVDPETQVTLNQKVELNFAADRYDPSPEASTLIISPNLVIANGDQKAIVTLYLRDNLSNLISGNEITLQSDRLNKDFILPLRATTNAQGIVTFSVSSTEYGDVFLSCMDNIAKRTLYDKAKLTFKAEPIPSTINSEVKANYGDVYVFSVGKKNETYVNVSVKDRFHNPLINDLIIATSNRMDDVLIPTSTVTDSFGRARFLLRSRYAGTSYITAMHNPTGIEIGKTTVEFSNPAITASMQLLDKDGVAAQRFVLGKDKIFIEISDANRNVDSFLMDTVSVNIINLALPDTENVMLQETGVDTGVFNNIGIGVSTNFVTGFPVLSNNILEGTYKNEFKVVYKDLYYLDDIVEKYALLDIERMGFIGTHIAYLNQNKDKAVIRYMLDEYSDIEIWIYNLRGEVIWREQFFASNEGALKSDQNIVLWNLRDMYNKEVPNGVYLYRILQKNSGMPKMKYTGKLLVVR